MVECYIINLVASLRLTINDINAITFWCLFIYGWIAIIISHWLSTSAVELRSTVYVLHSTVYFVYWQHNFQSTALLHCTYITHYWLLLALQVTLSLAKTDKFASMLNCALEVFGELLEVASLTDIGKCTEEILEYLKSLVSASSIATVSLVHQVYTSSLTTCST